MAQVINARKPNDGQLETLPYAGEVGKCAKCGKPLLGGKAGDIGHTCKVHLGKLNAYYKRLPKPPDNANYVTLSSLCRLAEQHGKTAYYMVKLTGGDGGTKPPINAIWQVYVWQGRKYLTKEASAELQKLLQTNK